MNFENENKNFITEAENKKERKFKKWISLTFKAMLLTS